jgi:ATP-dependent DNA helicase DinG
LLQTEEQWIEEVFSAKGLLSGAMQGYEERQQQKEMALQVARAYAKGSIALIEAGTGTGKSFAYLAPALFWALKHKEKTVISTHTISLQEQLLNKDIPFFLRAIKKEVKAVLVKGMKNYLCLRKLKEIQAQPLLIPPGEAEGFRALDSWAEKTEDGSRSDIPFPVAHAVWEKVGADGDSCNHVQCPQYKKCYFFKARAQADDAQILIVNHALLFSDIQLKKQEKEGILPSFQRLVLDEAHHVEQVALESSAQRLDRLHLLQSFLKVHADAHPEKSRLRMLKDDLFELSKLSPEWGHLCDAQIPEEMRAALHQLDQAFFELRAFFSLREKEDSSKLRLKKQHWQHALWQERIAPALCALADQMKCVQSTLAIFCKQLETAVAGHSKLMNHALELQSLSARCEQAVSFLERFTVMDEDPRCIRWIETFRTNIALFEASLDVSTFCSEQLFSPMRSSILCSATLTTARDFAYIKQRLGLSERALTECVYDSPFDFAARSMLLVPSDLPLPHETAYLPQMIFTIERCIEMSRGSAFVLFTSYEMLQACYRELSSSAISRKYPLYKQGDLPRHALLEQFKQREGSVLFATDSFWEGVDVPGDSLRCVIISKLPFPVPSEPLYEANAEALEKEGKDPFTHYAIPLAVMKFKQGFGRLLRTKSDRGCVLCLDPRLVKKNYGKFFLNSLPPAATYFAPRDKVLAEMQRFFN